MIIAFILFLVVKGINQLKRKQEAAVDAKPTAEPVPADVKLLDGDPRPPRHRPGSLKGSSIASARHRPHERALIGTPCELFDFPADARR